MVKFYMQEWESCHLPCFNYRIAVGNPDKHCLGYTRDGCGREVAERGGVLNCYEVNSFQNTFLPVENFVHITAICF
jgi:hypothetical protein